MFHLICLVLKFEEAGCMVHRVTEHLEMCEFPGLGKSCISVYTERYMLFLRIYMA